MRIGVVRKAANSLLICNTLATVSTISSGEYSKNALWPHEYWNLKGNKSLVCSRAALIAHEPLFLAILQLDGDSLEI